jgi:hypothetical protein
VSDARKMPFRLGELDMMLAPAMSYWDAKQLREFAKLTKDDHFAAVDLLVEIFRKCAVAGGSSVTKEEIEKNVVMPDGVMSMMAALFELGGPATNGMVM